MRIVYICTNCGNEIFPRLIDYEEAEQRNTESMWMKCDVYFTVHPCSCTTSIKHDVIKAISLSIKAIEDDLYKAI